MNIFRCAVWRRYAIAALPVLLLAMVAVNFKSVHADTLPVVNKSGTLTEDEIWSAGSVYVLAGPLTVPDNISLTIEPGAIIKYYFLSNTGINVAQGGTLNINGTSADPVVFTSYQDDTVGGDTNGDGSSTGGNSDYSSAIYVKGGSASISHAAFHSGVNAVIADCRYLTSPGNVVVAGSQLNGRVELDSCGQGVVSMQRNQLNPSTANANGEAIYAGYSDISGIILSGANENIVINSTAANVLHTYNATIAAGSALTVSGATGIVIYSQGIQVDGTLNLEEGAIIKGISGTEIDVPQAGTLNINGGTTNPVILTSYKDDSVGGDSNGDGGASSPISGDYGTAINAAAGATIALSNTRVRYASLALNLPYIEASLDHLAVSDSNYGALITGGKTVITAASFSHIASTGLRVSEGAYVTYRGSFSDIGDNAISACAWSSNACFVDAAYTDWGSSSGPFAATGDLVCGQVTVTPWVNQMSNNNIFSVKNCDNSATPSDQLTAAVQSYNQRMSDEQIRCGEGIQDVCVQISRTLACINAAIGLATYNSPFPLPESSPTDTASTYVGDYETSASVYVHSLEEASPQAFSTSVLSEVSGLVSIFSSLASAYNSCN